ncbi:unnamed protein product [Ixodes persulcatus]
MRRSRRREPPTWATFGASSDRADEPEALGSMRKNDLGGCTRVALKGAPFKRALVQQSNHISKPRARAPFQRAAPNLQKTVLTSQRRVLLSHTRAFREAVAIWVFNSRARNYIPHLEQQAWSGGGSNQLRSAHSMIRKVFNVVCSDLCPGAP